MMPLINMVESHVAIAKNRLNANLTGYNVTQFKYQSIIALFFSSKLWYSLKDC